MQGSVDFEDACSLIKGDYDRIRQVFTILLQNAVKYGEKGTEIHVYIKRQEHTIIAEVTDHGSVIPEEEWDQVFEKFYRASNHGGKGRLRTGAGGGQQYYQASWRPDLGNQQ